MTDTPEPLPPPTASTAYLWFVRAIAIVALATSGYLAWLALSGQTAAGCGGGKLDCDYVLSSRWSKIVDRPVGLAASSLWISVLLVSFFAAAPAPKLRDSAQLLLVMLTVAAAGAALWFIGLQAFLLKHWCTYCLIAHGCALVAAAVMLMQNRVVPAAKLRGAIAGVAIGALVPLAQLFIPPEPGYALDRVAESKTAEPLFVDGVAPGEAEYLEVLGGAAKINVAGLPRLGSPDAEYVLISLYDYACGHCRILHHDLETAQREYGGKLAIIMVPTPLSHRCNPYIDEASSTSPEACDLAKLALIVWAIEPQRFAAFDNWLFEPEKPRTAADARAKAAELIGEERLAAAEQEERFAKAIQQHVELRKRSPAELLPQIMNRDTILSAGVNSPHELVEALEKEFGWQR